MSSCWRFGDGVVFLDEAVVELVERLTEERLGLLGILEDVCESCGVLEGLNSGIPFLGAIAKSGKCLGVAKMWKGTKTQWKYAET